MLKLRKSKPKVQPRRHASGSLGRPQAFSYHAKRTDQAVPMGRQQPREQDNRHKARVMRQLSQRFGLVVAAVVLIVCVVDVLHLSPSPKVVSLTPSSNSAFLQPTATYQEAAQKLFASSIFNANKVTVQTEQIQAQLKAQFPELADVSVTLPLISHRPVVYVAPITPGLILSSPKGDFIISDNGKVLLPTSKIADLAGLRIPTVHDQSGLQPTTGKQALPSTAVSFIHTVVTELQAKGVAVDSIVLPSTAYELHVKPTGSAYYVKFNLHQTGEAMQQVGTYLAVRKRLGEQSVTPSQYVDVRVSGRAYYQ